MKAGNRYYIKPGDLLCNPTTGIMGIVTKVTKRYIHFYLMPDEKDSFNDPPPRATKEEIYFHIDKSELLVYYGSSKRRRTRPLSNLDNSFFETI